jgi:hypothetical protein
MVTEFIKQSENDTFVFILTDTQIDTFNEWTLSSGIEELIVYKMPRPITNMVHAGHGRRLTLVVISSAKHFWREWTPDI